MDAVTQVPTPVSEPVRSYGPGTPERDSLRHRLTVLAAQRLELTMTIGGAERMGGGTAMDVVQPHNYGAVLGVLRESTPADVEAAMAAAREAASTWRRMSFDDRSVVLLKAADLLSGAWRDTLNAATMLGQSKTCVQAEIDSACELIDFLRWNVAFGRQILEQQPQSSPGTWNRLDHRPLEGFVLAITPFNFTAIAANLPLAPALMGNTVVWKPAPAQQLAAHYTMRLLEQAGMPPGVINMVTGSGSAVSEVALVSPDLAGIHFTGSTATFHHIWRTVGENIGRYRGYPRVVGETGGKDFVVAHPSADADVLRTALIRGAFEYSGQKCSAASRAYLPRSLWDGMREEFLAEVEALPVGDVTDFTNFTGAVIDRRAYDRLSKVLEAVAGDPAVKVVAGGTTDDAEGYFVRPTVLECSDPHHEIFRTEYFGPILAVYVYEDGDFAEALDLVDTVATYALTGAVIAQDRQAIVAAESALRFSAGNFYINDKPTGAVVGQQPFGGSRASGTNDKAGSVLNLLRWVSPRALKEVFVPPTDFWYPHMGTG